MGTRLSIDPAALAAIVFKAAKTAGITTAALGGYVVAQTTTTLELAGNLGLVALLAVLVGRYTFRQLEDYRADLKATRKRSEHLEEELASARSRIHELEGYAHRLGQFITSAGIAGAPELPDPDASSS